MQKQRDPKLSRRHMLTTAGCGLMTNASLMSTVMNLQATNAAIQGQHEPQHCFTVKRGPQTPSMPTSKSKYLLMMVRIWVICTQRRCYCVKTYLEVLTSRIAAGSLCSYALDMCTLHSHLLFNRKPGAVTKTACQVTMIRSLYHKKEKKYTFRHHLRRQRP